MSEPKKRGFASMSIEKRKWISSQGGKASQANGTAHRFTREEAIEAGRKGGTAASESGLAHRWTSEEAREAGRKGGKSAHEKGVAHRFTHEEAVAAGKKGRRKKADVSAVEGADVDRT